ncbi:hypothetical protein [Knoellia koreensis]|uniref:LPXTG cell wall anchor domain-containing protein n=1 Tax=Knoellia koreensis TaxID=2730921 RepID=A0A849HN86_9MICO|nr:hypothetical protein [Knoellia sp. DB2414S]NNM46067.1 hypothetical protein [Knoellia sp. DB2414S]
MSRWLARVVPAILLAGAGGFAVPVGSADAAACSGTSGVNVVIDYGSSTTVSCAPGDPSSAMAALKSVASVVSPQRYPGTVVCRINGIPASDPCVQMPPANAYWAFYHAPAGGSWTYSNVGVAGYNPAPGSSIGFAFGAGARPSVAPPASAPKPSPKPNPSSSRPKPPAPPAPKGTASSPKPKASSTAGTPGAPRGSASAGSGAGSTPKVTVLPNGKTSTLAPTSSTTSSTTTSATTTSGTSTTTTDGATTQGSGDGGGQAMAPTSQPADGSGSNAPFWAGVGLVVLIGAAAAYLARRRRAQH